MSLFRSSTLLRAAVNRPALAISMQARLPTAGQRLASQDYGSGQGNPVGEHPKEAGKSESSRNLEHPGPAPPKAAQKGQTQERGHQQSTQASSKAEESQPSKQSSGKKGQSGKKGAGPQPKILNENPPDEKDESVRQHNEEFDKRADRAHEGVNNKDASKDKVSSKFWSGTGGADREP